MVAFLRAVVMLVTLVGLPAAWIYYGPLPPGPQRVVDRFVEVARDAFGWKQEPKSSVPETQTAAPRFESADDRDSVPRLLDSTVTPTAPAASNPRVSLVSAQTPVENFPLFPLAENEPPDTPGDLAQQLEPHFTLLRSLGASDYKLEKWGDAGREYRFVCSVPLGADAALERNFQTIDADPVAAVRQVVGEVTSWQNARLAPDGSVTRLR